jgi:mono/diheme cytochrome c family protein
VQTRCTVCHTRERIDNAEKTEAEWAATVDRMIGHGAVLNEAERAAVIAYLAGTDSAVGSSVDDGASSGGSVDDDNDDDNGDDIDDIEY